MALIEIRGTPLHEGRAAGQSLLLSEPLSFWGGLDPATGEIVDRHHPRSGAITTGKILVMPHGRGSSGASSILAECIRAGTGPVGIVLEEPDAMLLVGSLVAAELYPDLGCPLVVAGDAFDQLVDDVKTRILPDGTVIQQPG